MSELFHVDVSYESTEQVRIPVAERDVPSITFPEATLLRPTSGDSRSRSVAEATQEQLWTGLSSLYDSNVTLKADAAGLDPATAKGNSEGRRSNTDVLNDLLDTFMNGADAVLNELSILGNAHPVLALAIFAFHEVVKLDVARRDNNKKVLVVVLQMQNMLGPMFQLRNLNHKHMPDDEREYHENRLKELVEVITQDIKICRSDITHFMNRKFVYKLVLARGYEKKFASHIETFAQRRSELQAVISEYVAIGISTANIAISAVGTKVDVVDEKLDKIITALFRNVDTPREKDVLKFFNQYGGPKKCVEDSDLLPKLISKAGESPKTGKVAIGSQAELEELQKELIEALNEDLDKVLDKHFLRFEKVLQVQSNNMKRMSAHLEDQGVLMQTHTSKLGKILDTVTTIMVLEEGKVQTKAIKLKDPEIQRVWTQMNLTSRVVKAKVFVLTFRDHIRVDNSNVATPTPESIPLPDADIETNALQLQSAQDLTRGSNSRQLDVQSKKDSDEWVLEYIDVAYVQPIVEAMDEDGSGFISVQEANRFALSRPDGISLLHWIAYWAAGWHHNLTKYQKEIYEVLLQMNDALPNVHVANRVYVDDYLDQKVMARVEALLRSVRSLSDTSRKDWNLIEVAEIVGSKQMKQLEVNFHDMGRVVESSLDATTIAGGARVETWILPLLLLLLRRHFEIIHVSKTIVLDPLEFHAHTKSLENVFAVFDERLHNLEAKFRQLHNDVDAQFLNFSYGMFNAAFKKTECNIFDNTLMTLKVDEYPHTDTNPDRHTAPDVSILSKPIGKTLELEEVDFTPSKPLPENHVSHPMEGEWLGWFQPWNSELSYWRPCRCVIHPIIDKKIVGKVEGFFGNTDIIGSVEALESGEIKHILQFDFLPSNETYRPYSCQGSYQEDSDSIEGTYVYYTPPDAEVAADPPNGASDASGTSGNETGDEGQPNSITDSETLILDSQNDNSEPLAISSLSHTETINEDVEKEDDDATKLALESPRASLTAVTSPQIDSTVDSGISEPEGNEPIPENGETASTSLGEKGEDLGFKVNEVATNTVAEVDAESMVNDTDETNTEQPGMGRFNFKRTPAHLFSFRRYIDGPYMPPCWGSWPIARKRWAFAIEAILSETRARMNSRKSFNEALADRRKWLYCSMRYDQKDEDITSRWQAYELMTDKEWDVYNNLLALVPPSIALIYEQLSHYMARREAYLIPVGRAACDVCRWNISFTRHQCIYCMEDDMSDYVDLCHNCIDKPVTLTDGRTFSHSKSHSLIRSQHRIHLYEFNAVIPQARLISERSKKMFRVLEEQRKMSSERHVRRPVKGKPGARKNASTNNVGEREPSHVPSVILCACCNEAVSLPCWVCVVCSPLTFFCARCERTNAEVSQGNRNHSRRDHQILRIYDSIEVKSVRQNQMNDVGRQLADINSNISSLDEKINKQMEEGKEIKGVVDDVAKKVGAWNENDVTASLGAWLEEQNLEELAGVGSKVDGAPQASEAGDDANVPAPISNNPEKRQSDLEKRMTMLEAKVGDIGAKMDAKIDAIDQKLDALFNLVQNLVSRTAKIGPEE